MKKLFTLFKGSPIAMVVAGVLVAGVVSAAILAVYTTMVGEGDVQQSVVFGNGDTEKTYTIGDSPAIAGNTYTQSYNLLNRSETTAPIKFVTNQCMVGGGHCGDESYDEPGITTSYWSTVQLENKDSSWAAVTGDGMEGTLTYELVASVFNYKFEAAGLDIGVEYSLIYYADKQDRFVDWGGDNPGALIATATADEDGKISIEGSKNLAMNLPHLDDWNGSTEANYCDYNNIYDDYDLCKGAKIWLVPSNDYEDSSQSKLVAWNPTKYLFETDLITYDDSDTDGEALYLGKGKLNFFVKNELSIDAAPGTYQVKTKVVPTP